MGKTIRTSTIIAKRAAHNLIHKMFQKSDNWETFHKTLANALTRAWTDNMQKGIINALNTIHGLGAGNLTDADTEPF